MVTWSALTALSKIRDSIIILLFPPSPSLPPSFSRVCAPRGSSICSEFFYGQHVLTNSTDTTLEYEVREMVISLQTLRTTSTAIGNLDADAVGRCADIVTEILCNSAFPFCTPNSLVTRPICRRTCDLFRDGGACEGVVTLQDFPETYELIMSNCDGVLFPGGNSPECVQVQFNDSLTSGGKSSSLVANPSCFLCSRRFLV